MSNNIEGKVGVITGSTAGITFAIARASAPEGARVIFNVERNINEWEEVI